MMIRSVSMLVLIGVLAGCGGAPTVQRPPATTTLATTVEAPAATTGAASTSTSGDDGVSAAATPDENGQPTRSVSHAFGTTDVPLNPRRVVALDAFFTLTPLIELGVPVIGSVSLGDPAQYPGLTEQESQGIASIGEGRLANVETIAALDPDLIIGVDFVEPPYEQLQQIAPTVIIKTALDWKDQHRALGEATGKLAEAEQGIAAYEARVGALRARMPDVTASYLSLSGDQPAIYLLSDRSWAPIRVLDEAGVKRPADEVVTEGDFYKPISLEVLPDLKGDVLLYPERYPGIDEASLANTSTVVNGAIWQQIPAVKAGKVYAVDGRCWDTFGGLRSANCVLDEIERIFLAP